MGIGGKGCACSIDMQFVADHQLAGAARGHTIDKRGPMNEQMELPCCALQQEPAAEAQQPAPMRYEWYPKRLTERTYRILHKPTHTWAQISADSAEEAVRIAGCNHPATWPELDIFNVTDDEVRAAALNHPYTPGQDGTEWRMEDCEVRQYTGRGWGSVRE